MNQPTPKADLNNPNEIIRILKKTPLAESLRHDAYHQLTKLTWCKRCKKFQGNEDKNVERREFTLKDIGG